jgi:PPE-repeat protein
VAHFAWLPPEINSALLYSGAGAAPLLAAAEAWGGLAEDLASSAASFGSVTTDLVSNSWQGASSAAMMEVATQYLGWLSAAAVQAEGAASQAAATATAFETALVATVQPAVVQANRMLQQVLAATDFFGFNIPAIMDTEAAYEAMWAADVAAMFGYHADASEAAGQLSPWEEVLQGLGFHVNSNGKISLGMPSSSTSSTSSVGSTSTSSSSTAGTGTTGGTNIGVGNQGTGNIGFGNTGNNDFGIGLTGNNQFGIGNLSFSNSTLGFLNSGGGNIGVGNLGAQNMSAAASGGINSGLVNNGYANTGLWQGSPEASALSNHAVTGGLGAANLSSGILNSAATGGITPGLGSPDVLSPVMNSAAASSFSAPTAVVSANNSGAVSPANGTSPAAGPRAGVSSSSDILSSITKGEQGISQPGPRQPFSPE